MLPFSAVVPMDVENQAYVQLRGEERLRSGTDIKTAESELNPLVRYDYIWHGGQDHFVALYQPRFVYTVSWDRKFPNPNLINPESLNRTDPNKTPFSALHNGGVGFERVRPRWRLSLYQFAAFGPISTTALLVSPPWNGVEIPPEPNPIVPATIGARFTLLFIQTQLFVPIKLSPRTALTPGFTYNAFGGADTKSRGVIALTLGPAASLTLDHLATREDRLVTSLVVGNVNTKFQDDRDGVTIYRAEVNQAWRHYYSKHLTSELSAGASIGGDQINGFAVYSLAEAALLYDSWRALRIPPGAAPFAPDVGRGQHLQVGLVLKATPWIDLFSGDLEERAVAIGAINYGVGRVTLRGSIAHARVINTPRSVAQYQLTVGETSLRYQIVPTFSADAGLRVGYQDFNNAVRFNELTQITAFAGVLWQPLPARWHP